MADELTDFFRAAESEFKWLVTDFGFQEVTRDSDSGNARPLYGSITWASKKTFVEVVLEIPRHALDVQFGALIAGRAPNIFDREGRYHLGGLVVVRGHDERRASKLGDIGLRKGQIERGLRENAKALRELGSDVLGGDHTIFKELDTFGQWHMSQYRAKYLPR